MSAPAELARLCARVGKHVPLWTQGPGGNVSVKESGPRSQRLWIKASGLRLDQIGATSGQALLDLASFRRRMAPSALVPQNIEAVYSALLTELSEPGFGRPSMETGFHALLPRRLVFHFHSLCALLMAHHHALEPAAFSQWVQQNSKLAVTFLAPCLPGWGLSQQVAAHAAADALVLKNHGVILQSNDDGVLEQWQRLEERFCARFGYESLTALAANPSELASAFAGVSTPLKIYFPDSAVFLDRLQVCLQPGASPDTFVLLPLAWQRDRDVAEIWLASQLLYKLCPDLAELPPSIASTVASLPAEEWRRRMAQKSA